MSAIRRRAMALLALGLAAGCDSGPKSGAITAELTTPHAELGAIMFSVRAVEPETIDTVGAACSGCQAYVARVSEREVRAIVTGRFGLGPVAEVTVSNRDLTDAYDIQLLQAAKPSFDLVSLAGSDLRFPAK